MNFKNILVAFCLAALFTACKDDDSQTSDPSIEEYLDSNSITNFKTTDSGLVYVIANEGEGDFPLTGDSVILHYTGYLTSNIIFDTSVERDPLGFVVGIGQVIPGFDEGAALLKEGGMGTLFIPSELAYGERGAGSAIEPGADIIFDISIEKIVPELSRVDIDYYLEDNELTGFSKTNSGLYYKIINEGEGDFPSNGQMVKVEYTGYFLNDEIFDSTIERDEPFTFELGSSDIIVGFNEAVSLLKLNGSGEFLIPSDLAYGESGSGDIAPNQDLKYSISISSIE